MKTILAAISLFILPFALQAQKQGNVVAKEYTHITDFKFPSAPDLVGYTIHPKEGKLSSSPIIRTVKLGLVEFKITESELFVVENVKYSTTGIISESDYKNYRLAIQQTTQNKAGGYYEMILMEFRNPDVQGHLKVYYNVNKEITMLQFKPNPTEPERTYELIPPSVDIENRDSKFFTHTEDIEIEVTTDLWSRKQTVFPFSQIRQKAGVRQNTRIYPSDRVKIAFNERTELKGKKERLVQYIEISQLNEDNQEQKIEYTVKKIREVSTNPKDKTASKNIEITLQAGMEEGESLMILLRDIHNKITGIEFKTTSQNTSYYFRPGKHK
jgi:hypothetical protein